MDNLNFFKNIGINIDDLNQLKQKIDNVVSNIGQHKFENEFVLKILNLPEFEILNTIYQDLKDKKICFVANIADGVGHWIAELDYFFRKQHLNEIDANYFILIRKPNHLADTCLSYYGHKFDLAACDNNLYNLFLPITMHFHDITFDAGLSRLKWQMPKDNYVPVTPDGQSYVHQINKKENRNDWERYYSSRSKTVDYYPLKINTTKEEVEIILKKRFKKIAIIHLKNASCNAAAAVTTSATYLPTILFLKKQGYTVVFGGREVMPREYRSLGVINYAESPQASFSNDFKLFSQASNTIMCASGVSLLSECLEIPLIYFNHWHIARVPFPKNSICVPSLVKEKKTGRTLSFLEQILLYNNRPDVGAEIFPFEEYESINATAEDLLQSTIEMEDLIKNNTPMNDLQLKFNKIHNEGQIVDTLSRISSHFVTTHQNLITT